MGGTADVAVRVMQDWQGADLEPADQALCRFAERLTRAPGAFREADVEELRVAGFSDVALHRAVQVIGYFNYINRVADAVHVELEPEMPDYPDGSR